MFLSKISMDLANRQVMLDLADRDRLHVSVLRLFPDFPGNPKNVRERLGVLFRVEAPIMLLQSKIAPLDSRIPQGYKILQTKDVTTKYLSTKAGSQYRFRLEANASHREEAHGRRVACQSEEESEKWLARRAALAGFTLLDLGLTTLPPLRARRGTFHAVRYEGALEVKENELFQKALSEGIGQGKIFGLGMLSIG